MSEWIKDVLVSRKTFPDRAIIIKEGQTGDEILVVLEGKVRIKKMTAKGSVTLEILQAGSVIGEMLVVNRALKTRTASVVADGEVRIGILNTRMLLDQFESLTPQSRVMIRSLVYSLAQANRLAIELAPS